VTRPFDFGWTDRVNQQVRVTVDQPGQQSHRAEIDRFGARRRFRLHLGGRPNFLDLPAFNQHGGG
jgi:hypothetical protein